MYDIVIIGAGVVGGMIAHELAKYDLSVCVLEKTSDVAEGATKANSGIVHAGFDALPGTLKADLNVKGSEMMEAVTNELGVEYKKNGSLVIAFSDDEMKTVKELYKRGIKNGVKQLEIVDKEQLKKLEPNVSDKSVGALYAPGGAIVCPYGLAIAAIGNAMDKGVELKLEFEVSGITDCGDYYEVMSHTAKVQAKYIINAAGVFTDKISEMAGFGNLHIHARRGEYMLLDRECGGMVSHTVFQVPTKLGKGILVSATVSGNLLLGPTAEDVLSKYDTATTPHGLEAIIKGALKSVPGVPLGKVITSFSGLRAVSDSGDFIIRAENNKFINVGGIESPGLSASPAIARYVANILKSLGVSLIKRKNYTPNRNIVKADEKKYNKIICRCETVSEGEIIEAMRTNPKAYTIDAVKRRTRSGMGRCQGGFCMPSVAELLSKELNKDLSKITKFGGESRILIGKSKVIL